MKHTITFLLLLIAFSSCRFSKGSGDIISENRTVDNFTGLTVSNDFEVEVKIGPVTTVKVEADDNIMKYIEIKESGGVLKIKTKRMNNFVNTHMKVYITAPVITNIKASASANVEVIGVLKSSEKLVFKASSSGTIKATVDAPEVDIDASSASTVKLEGKTKNCKTEASSGANIIASNLLSENTTVQASSGGEVAVYASVNLKVNASSGANVRYYGNASITQELSSGASLNKKD